MGDPFLQVRVEVYKNLKAASTEGIKQQQIEEILNTAHLLILSCKETMLNLIAKGDQQGIVDFLRSKEDSYKMYCSLINNIHLAPLFMIKLLQLLPMTLYYYDDLEKNVGIWENIYKVAQEKNVRPDQTLEFKKYVEVKIAQNSKNIPDEVKEYIK